jgi:hypothetical protein
MADTTKPVDLSPTVRPGPVVRSPGLKPDPILPPTVATKPVDHPLEAGLKQLYPDPVGPVGQSPVYPVRQERNLISDEAGHPALPVHTTPKSMMDMAQLAIDKLGQIVAKLDLLITKP